MDLHDDIILVTMSVELSKNPMLTAVRLVVLVSATSFVDLQRLLLTLF